MLWSSTREQCENRGSRRRAAPLLSTWTLVATLGSHSSHGIRHTRSFRLAAQPPGATAFGANRRAIFRIGRQPSDVESAVRAAMVLEHDRTGTLEACSLHLEPQIDPQQHPNLHADHLDVENADWSTAYPLEEFAGDHEQQDEKQADQDKPG